MSLCRTLKESHMPLCLQFLLLSLIHFVFLPSWVPTGFLHMPTTTRNASEFTTVELTNAESHPSKLVVLKEVNDLHVWIGIIQLSVIIKYIYITQHHILVVLQCYFGKWKSWAYMHVHIWLCTFLRSHFCINSSSENWFHISMKTQ